MLKWLIIMILSSASFGFDIQKMIDKNAIETQSYKEFVTKYGRAKYHLCKNGILFQIAHNPYENAPKESMMRNLLFNPIKCDVSSSSGELK